MVHWSRRLKDRNSAESDQHRKARDAVAKAMVRWHDGKKSDGVVYCGTVKGLSAYLPAPAN